MNKFHRILSVVLALMLCLTSVVALGEAADTAEATEVVTSPEDVLALVNGTPVTRADFEEVYTSLQNYYYEYYGYDVASYYPDMFNQMALSTAVETVLMDQKAKDLGYDQFTAEEETQLAEQAAAEWAEIIDYNVTNYMGLTAEATEEEIAAARVSVLSALEASGYTEAYYLEMLKQDYTYTKVQDYILKDVAVAESEVKAAFDSYVLEDEAAYKDDVGGYEYMTQYYGSTSYYTPEGYRGVTHILLEVDETLLATYEELNARLEEQQEAEETAEEAAEDGIATLEAPVTQEQVDEAYAAIIASVQPTIDEINQKMADGATFAEMIELYGNDEGMTKEPVKSEGYPVHMDSILWDPAFVKAAFSVDNVGDIAEPVVGMYGVHIVQYTRDVPAGPVEFTQEVYDVLYAQLLNQKQNEAFSAMMSQWTSEAEIVYSAEAEAMLAAQ